MHLSLLSDAFISDSLSDTDPLDRAFAGCDLGRAHREGLLRGLLFALALALPLGLTVALAPARSVEVAAPAPSSLRVMHLHMS